MNKQTLEQLYRQFTADGDVDALAEVFDRVAPDLERLARRLTTDRNQAADLVQDTFLTALERPGTFDANRALRPWLLGILVHRASEARRCATREAKSQSFASIEEHAPLAILGAAEFRAEVTRAVCELPESMRRVVEGRLFDERNAGELARELEISQGALRVRLHRGLERLRRTLPAGLAMGLAMVFMHSKGLAQARTQVLRYAVKTSAGKGAVASTATSSVGKLALSKNIAGVIGALAITLVAGWVYLESLSDQKPSESGLAFHGPNAMGPEQLDGKNDPVVFQERVEVELALAASPSDASVTVRVSLESGGPAVGFAVDLGLHKAPPVDWIQSETDAAGIARFTVPAGTLIRRLRVPATATTPSLAKWVTKTCEAGTETQLDQMLSTGYPISGRVVDLDGRPVPNAEVRGWSSTRMDGRPDRVALTNSDGEFQVEHIGKEFVLEARTDQLACVQGLRGSLSHHNPAVGLELVVGPSRRVHGVVTSQQGSPIEGAEVWVPNGLMTRSDRNVTHISGIYTFGGSQGRTMTDAHGRFEISHLSRDRAQLNIKKAPYLVYTENHDTGEAPISAVLDRGALLSGRVWNSDGSPAVGASVQFWPFYANVHLGPSKFSCNERGEFTLTGMSIQSDFPEISPAVGVLHEGHAVAIVQPVVPNRENRRSIDIRLRPEKVISGRVVNMEGEPVEGCTIRVEGQRELDLNTSYGNTKSTWEYQAGINQQSTDDQGMFRFDRLYEGEFEVIAMFPKDVTRTINIRVPAGTEDLLIKLDPEMADKVVLVGTLRDEQTNQPIETFKITPFVGNSGYIRSFTGQAHGEFKVSGLSPGPIELSIVAEGYAEHRIPEREYSLGRHRLHLTLAKERSLELRVVDGDNKPRRFGHVKAIDLDGTPLRFQTPMGSTGQVPFREGFAHLHGLPARQVTLKVLAGARDETGVHDFPVDLREPHTQPLELVIATGYEKPKTGGLILGVLVAHSEEEEASLRALIRAPLREPRPDWVLEAARTGTLFPRHDLVVSIRSSEKVLAIINISRNENGTYSISENRPAQNWDDFGRASSASDVPQAMWHISALPNERIEIECSSNGYRRSHRTVQPKELTIESEPTYLILRPKNTK